MEYIDENYWDTMHNDVEAAKAEIEKIMAGHKEQVMRFATILVKSSIPKIEHSLASATKQKFSDDDKEWIEEWFVESLGLIEKAFDIYTKEVKDIDSLHPVEEAICEMHDMCERIDIRNSVDDYQEHHYP